MVSPLEMVSFEEMLNNLEETVVDFEEMVDLVVLLGLVEVVGLVETVLVTVSIRMKVPVVIMVCVRHVSKRVKTGVLIVKSVVAQITMPNIAYSTRQKSRVY